PRLVAEIPPPPGTHFTFGGSYPGPPVISPDGRQVMFVARNVSGRNSLWLRALDQEQAREVFGGSDLLEPFWSPDSKAIGFFTNAGINGAGKLMLLSLSGGLPRPIAVSLTPRGGTWNAQGTVLFAPNISGGLARVSVNGGAVTAVTHLESSQFSSHRFPYFLPDGQHFLFLAINHNDPAQDTLYWASLDGRDHRALLHSLTGGIYASGSLLYSAAGTLLAQPFDPASGKLSGTARAVASGVFDDNVSWRPAYSASQTGVLVYAAGAIGSQQVAWVDRLGVAGGPLPAYDGEAITAAVSPDGRRLALSLDAGLQDIWTEDVSSGARSRLTFGPVADLMPVWSPDGASIAYSSSQHGRWRVMRRPAAGGSEQAVAPQLASDQDMVPYGWSPDGRELLCLLRSADGQQGLAAVTLDGSGMRTVLPQAKRGLTDIALSPDGKWVSYLGGAFGELFDLYVVPFRGGSGQWQVTTQGASHQYWTQGGRELDVVENDGRLVAIAVGSSGGAPVFGTPKLLAANFPPTLAATPDGQHFLATFYPDDHTRLRLVTGWNRP
ncbi:MAG: TolB family protein, partial [Terriglobales bacterium]